MIIFINRSGSYIYDTTEEDFESNLVVQEEDGKYVCIGNVDHINKNVIGWLFHYEAGYKIAQSINASAYYVEVAKDKMYKYNKKQVKSIYNTLKNSKKKKN